MSVDTREDLVRRYAATSTIAGWIALAGCLMLIVGFGAQIGILSDWLGVLAPLGVFPMLFGGIVSMGAAQLADRHRTPAGEDVEP